ncbi:hypothetical protein LWI29_035120 [Acer saccharum]|uniref:Uncharacterized protein n=1 Tax=Acer saccharum TaxID=4024 RepID=A0AA39VWK9_ACESA|nr:hypothetical protein LWI29_035120 [Acer saccharum]
MLGKFVFSCLCFEAARFSDVKVLYAAAPVTVSSKPVGQSLTHSLSGCDHTHRYSTPPIAAAAAHPAAIAPLRHPLFVALLPPPLPPPLLSLTLCPLDLTIHTRSIWERKKIVSTKHSLLGFRLVSRYGPRSCTNCSRIFRPCISHV